MLKSFEHFYVVSPPPPPIILQLGAAAYFVNFHFIENSCVSKKKVSLEQHEEQINEKFSFLDAILLYITSKHHTEPDNERDKHTQTKDRGDSDASMRRLSICSM